MTAAFADLPFISLYARLDASEKPMYISREAGKGVLNQVVPDEFVPIVERFATAARAELQDKPDGTLVFDGVRCRLSQWHMADGSQWICARQINATLPELDKLGFSQHIVNHLRTLGQREGLILLSGPSKHGKTTTAVGLLIDFMKTHGGTAVALENPVEYVIKGRHGDFGYCFQTDVGGDDGWDDALNHAMRWGPRYIFIGEVRTPKAAEQMLRAARMGHTVITTLQGGMPEEALVGLLFLAEQAMGSGAADILAGCLTALLHQTMKEEGPFVRYLFTEENAPSDPIRSLIREGKIGMLSTYIDRIAARLANQPALQPAVGFKPGMAPAGGIKPSVSQPLPPLPPLPPIRK